jgi:hypothetical protein
MVKANTTIRKSVKVHPAEHAAKMVKGLHADGVPNQTQSRKTTCTIVM